MTKDIDITSSIEKNFVLTALKEGSRVDTRGPYDYRPFKVTAGSTLGTVEVQLGRTRLINIYKKKRTSYLVLFLLLFPSF